ncbi:MAG: hypothetical protein M1829_002026 [Trizodia sp. TS-e1964]|nr:MAG: hypothetical protein M1829_002026 [Trizodia sp. TS-e1964]
MAVFHPRIEAPSAPAKAHHRTIAKMILLPDALTLLQLLLLTPSLLATSTQQDNSPLLLAGLRAARTSLPTIQSRPPHWLLFSFPGRQPLQRPGFLALLIPADDMLPPHEDSLLWQQSANSARIGECRLVFDLALRTQYLSAAVLGPMRVEGVLVDAIALGEVLDRKGEDGADVRGAFMKDIRKVPGFRALGEEEGEG